MVYVITGSSDSDHPHLSLSKLALLVSMFICFPLIFTIILGRYIDFDSPSSFLHLQRLGENGSGEGKGNIDIAYIHSDETTNGGGGGHVNYGMSNDFGWTILDSS